MAPKVVARAKAKARARAGALRAGVALRAAPGIRRPASSRISKKRPAADEEEVDLEAEALKRWEKGYSVRLSHLSPRDLEMCKGLVVLEATYYHRPVTLAGRVNSIVLTGGSLTLRMSLTGTGDEELLKYHTSQPGTEIRAHVCEAGCNQEEAAEDLVHIQVGRKMKEDSTDDPWVTNLVRARPMEEGEVGQERRGSSGAGPWSRKRSREEEEEREGREPCHKAEGQKREEEGKESPSQDSKEEQCRRVRGDGGGPSIRWQSSTSGLPEEVKGPVWRNRDRPSGTGAKSSREESKEAPEEAVREEQLKFEPRREPEKLLERGGRSRGESVRTGLQSADHSGALPRSSCQSGSELYAVDVVAGDRVRRPPQHPATGGNGLLQTASAAASGWTYGSRADDAFPLRGSTSEGAASICVGHNDTAYQVHRTELGRQPLDRQPAPGDTPLRELYPHGHPRSYGSTEGDLPGGQVGDGSPAFQRGEHLRGARARAKEKEKIEAAKAQTKGRRAEKGAERKEKPQRRRMPEAEGA